MGFSINTLLNFRWYFTSYSNSVEDVSYFTVYSSFGPYFSSSALMLSTPGAFVVFQTFCSSFNFFSRERIIHFGWFVIFHFVNVFFVECFFKDICHDFKLFFAILSQLVKPSSPITRMLLVYFFCSIRTAWYILLESFLYVSITSTDCIILEVSSSSII